MNGNVKNIIKINWLDKGLTMKDVFIEKEELVIPEEYRKKHVLYQIYGDSPIYGLNTLLYIGRTKHLETRIEQHIFSKFSRITNFSIRFGELELQYLENQKTKQEILEIAETILITMLKPSHNSQNINNIHSEAQGENGEIYIILNTGNKGLIPLEVSNIWWYMDKLLNN